MEGLELQLTRDVTIPDVRMWFRVPPSVRGSTNVPAGEVVATDVVEQR